MRIVLILAVALNGLASVAFAQSANNITPLSDLQPEVRDDIARICLPIQYRDGAVAYRICVKDQIAQRKEISRLDKVMNTFSNLSFDDRYAIQQACGSTDSQNARKCTDQQITALLSLPEPNLSDLSSDEQYVMQQTCFHAQSKQGAAAYRLCQISEIASVENIATPDYANMGAIERNTLQLKCSANQSQLADYRNCLIEGRDGLAAATRATEAVAKISNPVVEASDSQTVALVTAPVSVRVQTNPASSVKPESNKPESNLSSLSEPSVAPAVAPAAVSALSAPTETLEPVLEAEQIVEPTNQPQAQSTTDAQPVETVQSTETVTTTTVENTESISALEGSEPDTNIYSRVKNFLLDAFSGLSTQGKMLLGAIVLMPLALLALLSGRGRNRFDYEDDNEYEREDLKARARPRTARSNLNNSQFHDDDENDISSSWEAEVDSLFDDTPTIQPEPTQQRSKRVEPPAAPAEAEIDYSKVDEYAPTRLVKPTHAKEEYAPTKLVSPPQAAQAAQAAQTTQAVHPSNDVPTQRVASSAAGNEFANWLHSLPRNEQQSLAIEFLLYWIAFGDERFEPSLKQQIFQKQDPSNKDIVKRWVLKEDVQAFADVIDWLQRNTTHIQKVQVVHLLMAMLVNGHEPTPVQNTVFRFLGDVFYLKSPTLDEMFEEDFQATLPSMPRVDRMAWWDGQSAGTIASWNARKLNNSDEITRLAAQLGVDGEARSEHVEAAYELAAYRCSPERFDHLGENEHRMVQARLNRLQQARDGLLEALA